MKVCIYTLGCKVNQYESDAIVTILKNKGYEVVKKLTKSDIYVLNTCAVTNEAEKKSRQMLAKFKELNPNAKVVICGCASQKNAEQFRGYDNVTYITGVANKTALLENLEAVLTRLEPLPLQFEEQQPDHLGERTRAYIKIQDGCNNFCSYCIIPYLRGRSRSRNIISILKEAEKFSKTAKEIVLTGIDMSDFKVDGQLALAKLLQLLDTYNVRLRLGSLEVRLITPDFIKKIKKVKNFCPHFHLSLQSGSDKVLKEMNRNYTTQEYEDAVKLIRENFKCAAITTDIIVGFPTETEDDFEKTRAFARKIEFAHIHIFPYSKRSGTVAARLKDLAGSIKKDRVKMLQRTSNEGEENFILKNKNRIREVLIEEQEEGFWTGHTKNYIKCYVNGEFKQNDLVKVKILKQFRDGALAKKI